MAPAATFPKETKGKRSRHIDMLINAAQVPLSSGLQLFLELGAIPRCKTKCKSSGLPKRNGDSPVPVTNGRRWWLKIIKSCDDEHVLPSGKSFTNVGCRSSILAISYWWTVKNPSRFISVINKNFQLLGSDLRLLRWSPP